MGCQNFNHNRYNVFVFHHNLFPYLMHFKLEYFLWKHTFYCFYCFTDVAKDRQKSYGETKRYGSFSFLTTSQQQLHWKSQDAGHTDANWCISHVNLTLLPVSVSVHLPWPDTERVQHLQFNAHLRLDLSLLVSRLYWLQWEQLACKYLPVTAAAAAPVGPLRKLRRAKKVPERTIKTPHVYPLSLLHVFTLSVSSQNKLLLQLAQTHTWLGSVLW